MAERRIRTDVVIKFLPTIKVWYLSKTGIHEGVVSYVDGSFAFFKDGSCEITPNYYLQGVSGKFDESHLFASPEEALAHISTQVEENKKYLV